MSSVSQWLKWRDTHSQQQRKELDATVPKYFKYTLIKKALKIRHTQQSYKLWINQFNTNKLSITQQNLRIVISISKYQNLGKFRAPFRLWNTSIIDDYWMYYYHPRQHFYEMYIDQFIQNLVEKYKSKSFDYIILEYVGLGNKHWILSSDLRKMRYNVIQEKIQTQIKLYGITTQKIVSIKDVYPLKIKRKCALKNCHKKNNNNEERFQICSGCKKMCYCCRKHQKIDWIQRHKFSCSIIKKR